MVSIMPGIDARAPERTLTSSGSAASPKRLPSSLDRASAACTSARERAGYWRSCAIEVVQTSVLSVKPGGTGMPRRLISARFAPLPPSSALSPARPSATPPPKA
jgi:hypothetical protein